jgi:hypothetical protein
MSSFHFSPQLPNFPFQATKFSFSLKSQQKRHSDSVMFQLAENPEQLHFVDLSLQGEKHHSAISQLMDNFRNQFPDNAFHQNERREDRNCHLRKVQLHDDDFDQIATKLPVSLLFLSRSSIH